MMRRMAACIGIALIFFLPSPVLAGPDWFLDFEAGGVLLGYNDVRVPNEGGTLFSLRDDLEPDPAAALRIRFGLRTGRHSLSLFGAPLTVKASGSVPDPLVFFEESFPGGAPLKAAYTFNSWRATYRYTLVDGERWTLGIGFTAKIRDAVIRVEGAGKTSEKTNVGFVPLINFQVRWSFQPRWSLLLEGDALASPGGQGRAEDILLALDHRLNSHLSLRAGYRLIEGGADVAEVYNFAWINLFTIGARFSF